MPLFVTFIGVLCALLYYATNNDTDSRVQGCRRFGMVNRSNMDDQYSAEYDGKDESTDYRVKALFVYPVKSCGIIELSESDVVATGLRYDRQFCFAQLCTEEAEKSANDMAVNKKWKHTWKFITQRKFAQLSQIRTELWTPDTSSPGYSPDLEWIKSGGCLVCRFAFTPDWEWSTFLKRETLKSIWMILKAKLSNRSLAAEPTLSFRLPLAPDATRITKYSREVMEIWKDAPEALNMTPEIPPETLAKLKYFLGISNPLALFMADPRKRRDVFRNAPTKEEAGYQPGVGFADAYPLSIMGLASVHDVASKMPAKSRFNLSAMRFRANIYVTGGPPFVEDSWKLIRMGSLSYHVSCRTTRCELPNVDPVSGQRHKQQPLLTLKKTRANVDRGAGPNPCLGMQMVPLLKDETGSEAIAVGDSVDVLETGEHFYVRMFKPGEQVLST
ncbi:MOSC domain-containing protein [Delphinella strobiligena]|nr:MOSC domain-containing protein [Delphinella strobiligena]